jgi:hypothetical protein
LNVCQKSGHHWHWLKIKMVCEVVNIIIM